ncbi:MAG: GNVR domain-containing protein [Ketobacteraceae bacterium]|nr:GNVR domain-containing protein [Ketobacteraceae bacterium]
MSITREQGYFREILGIFFANLPFIKRVFILCAALSLLIPFFVPKVYTLTGEIVVLSKKIQQGITGDMIGGTGSRYIPVSLTDMETENNIIRSLPLIRKTVKELHEEGLMYIEYTPLDRWVKIPLREYVISPIKNLFSEDEDSSWDPEVEELTKIALDSLEVATLPGSNVLTVNYEAKNPEMAQHFVNRLMANYIRKRNELILNEAPEDFFLQKKNIYKDRLKELEQRKVVLFNQYDVSNPRDELALTLESINQEENELHDLKDNRLEANAWLTYLKEQLEKLKETEITKISFPYSFGGTGSMNSDFYVDSEMKQQIQKIANLQSEYATARLSFRQDSAKVTKPFNQLKEEKKRLIVLVNNRILERSEALRVLDTVIENKETRIREFRNRARILKEVAAQEAEIITELSAVNDAYFRYSQQYEEKRSERIADLGDLSNVRILSEALLPLEPSSPKKLLVLILALITSGFIALTLGLIREVFDHRFRYPEQVPSYLDIPTIAVFDDLNPDEEKVPFGIRPAELWKWLIQ